jgi:hypothetical protein
MPPPDNATNPAIRATYLRDAAFRDAAVLHEYMRRRVARLVLPVLAATGIFLAMAPWGAVGIVFGAPWARSLMWTAGGFVLIFLAAAGSLRAISRATARGFTLQGVQADWTFSAARVVYDLGQGENQHSSSDWSLYPLVTHGAQGLRLQRAPALAWFIPASAFQGGTAAMEQVAQWARGAGVKVKRERSQPAWALAGAWLMASILLTLMATWICVLAALMVTHGRGLWQLFNSGAVTLAPAAGVVAAIVLALHYALFRCGRHAWWMHDLLGAAWGAGVVALLHLGQGLVMEDSLLAAQLLAPAPLGAGIVMGALCAAMIHDAWIGGLAFSQRLSAAAPSTFAQ